MASFKRTSLDTPKASQRLLVLFFLTHICCANSVWAVEKNTEERPNILFLFADDWGRHASVLANIDESGGVNDVVQTPHFDKVASRGVIFRNAHVSAPSCTPCRSALLTGRHFWQTGTGSILRGAVYDSSIPSFPPLLRKQGYCIGYSHKVWSPGTPANSPFTKAESFSKHGSRINQFSQTVTKLINKGTPRETAKLAILDEVRGNFRDMLKSCNDNAPFCYWFGPTNVHRKWIKGSGKNLWDINPDSLKGKMPAFLPDVPEVRQDLADYFGEIAAWDAAVGVLLDELEKANLTDNTLIVVSGDHGAPGFPHGKCNLYSFGTGVCLSVTGPGVVGGRVIDDMVSLIDLAPTFLEAARIKPPESMTGRSLWPLLRSKKSGHIDPTRDCVFTGRERHVENARSDFTPYPQRAIRTQDHVLIMNFRPDRWPLGDPYRLEEGSEPTQQEIETNTRVTLPDEDAGPTKAWLVRSRKEDSWKSLFNKVYGKRMPIELFDLNQDPYEMHNLAGERAHAELVKKLTSRLLSELSETGDPRLINDGEFYETPPMAGPLKEESPGGKNQKRKP